jgi:cytochrome c553
MKIWTMAAAMMAMTLTAGGAAAQEAAKAEALYKQVCRNCHGPTGKGMASFPKLAGHDETFLVSRLEQYRSGEMVGPNTALMRPHAEDLSDDQIAGLARYVATSFQ